MKLLADVNVSGRVVERLVDLGWEVDRLVDHVPATAEDEQVLELARTLDAVLLTRDQDFGALLAKSGAAQPAVVNVRCRTVDPQELAGRITQRCAVPRAISRRAPS